MDITLRSLYLVAVLHVLAFDTILCKIDVEREKRELREDGRFLAGEDTPVWEAKFNNEKKIVSYKKMQNGTVKRAIDYWKSDSFEGLPKKIRRSVDEIGDIVKNMKNSAIETFPTSSMRNVSEKFVEKRETKEIDGETVYRPSILIVLNYDFSRYDRSPSLIYDKILYTLAFWNSVDRQLRRIKKPRVHLRIAGIVIAADKKAVPYLRVPDGARWGIEMKKGLEAMTEYWRNMSKINDDFRDGSFDIVATMTDQNPSEPILEEPIESISTSGPPCYEGSNRTIAGLLLHDDLAFGAIQLGVKEVVNILAAKEDGKCSSEREYVVARYVPSMGRRWSLCALASVSATLKRTGWCLREAKEIHPPGKRVETILPGKLMPAKRQCEARKRKDFCESSTTCERFYCQYNDSFGTCAYVGPTPDGTKCGEGKICLDAMCVRDAAYTEKTTVEKLANNTENFDV